MNNGHDSEVGAGTEEFFARPVRHAAPAVNRAFTARICRAMLTQSNRGESMGGIEGSGNGISRSILVPGSEPGTTLDALLCARVVVPGIAAPVSEPGSA